jgi:hypothetical protein
MTVYSIDPLQDRRWEELLETHASASIFHTPGWLEALRRTYGYEPVLFTTSSSTKPLANGIVFCRINSYLTGSRMVSVPFADHCRPLVSSADELACLLTYLQDARRQEKYKYIELRVLGSNVQDMEASTGLTNSASFAYHGLDLEPDLETLFRGLHPSCVQRKIRRAEREGLAYNEGTSDEILEHFYLLLVLTRRRHGLPPQPLAWFRNLRDCLGGALNVRVASRDGQPIASILTLRFKNTIVYKYGCSDVQFHKLGAMPFLFWKTILEGKALGLHYLDLGRSSLEDQGLITFKEHLGASSSSLNYYRYPAQFAAAGILGRMVHTPKVCSYLPNSLLIAAGNFLYRHVG